MIKKVYHTGIGSCGKCYYQYSEEECPEDECFSFSYLKEHKQFYYVYEEDIILDNIQEEELE
jgi:hypothetical protein